MNGPPENERHPRTEPMPLGSAISATAVARFLVDALSQHLDRPPEAIGCDVPLGNLGVDSLIAVRISGQLEQYLQRRVDPTVLFDHATIASLAEHLASESPRPAPAAGASSSVLPDPPPAVSPRHASPSWWRDRQILLIKPSPTFGAAGFGYFRDTLFLQRTLPYLAAFFPPDANLRLVDESLEPVPSDPAPDVVLLTGMIHHVPRALALAATFRTRGARVIMGGPGAAALSDMVRQSGAVDALCLGEAEGFMPRLLHDLEQDRLQETYQNTGFPNLVGLPHPRYDLLAEGQVSTPSLMVETSRGCPRSCEFCSVSRFFGRKLRFRPIDEVLGELQALNAKFVFFTDDNICANPVRAAELFRALRPLDLIWSAQFDTTVAQRPQLLTLARASGCISAVVGIESVSPANLARVGKLHNLAQSLGEVTDTFHQHGISMMASMIYGFPDDDAASYQDSLAAIVEAEVDFFLPWHLTPMPGTPFFERFEREGRIIHRDYAHYDGCHCVLRSDRISPALAESTMQDQLRWFYDIDRIQERLRRSPNPSFDASLNRSFRSQVIAGRHPFFGYYRPEDLLAVGSVGSLFGAREADRPPGEGRLLGGEARSAVELAETVFSDR